MGTRRPWVAAVVLATVACSPDPGPVPSRGSLFLMNQTHERHRLALFRAAQPDCVATARDPAATLAGAFFEFERCITLGPAAIVSLDREPSFRELPPACEAVALEAPGLDPQALFWTDTDYFPLHTRTTEEALLALVSVDRALVLEPASNAYIAPLAVVPESPCRWPP